MLTLPNVIILIKLVLNKDQNHQYYSIFLEKYSYHLAKEIMIIFFDSIIMVRFGETKVAKDKFYGAKKKQKKNNKYLGR